MKQSPLEDSLEREIYAERLLLFLEHEDGFRQVMLNGAQFKQVSDAIITNATEPDERDMQTADVMLGERVLDKALFEDMSDISL